MKQYDEIARNFIVANYNSLGAVDNDDGSSYYYVSPRARAREQQGGGAYSLAHARRHASPRLASPRYFPSPQTHDNFFSYGGGGLKNDFEGHDNVMFCAQRRRLRACVRRLARSHRRPPPLPLPRPLAPRRSGRATP